MHQRYALLFVLVPLLLLAHRAVPGLSLPASTYDQRQTGDLNVQVHVKDVQVLALLDTDMLDDYTEYDYFYDYADFTITPIKPTTSTTTTTAVPVSSTTDKVDTTEEPIEAQNSQNATLTADSPSTNATAEDTKVPVLEDAEKINETSAISFTENIETSTIDTSTVSMKMGINDKTKRLFADHEGDATVQNGDKVSTEHPTKELSKKRCKSGYSPNGRGRCRRLSQRRLSLIPLAVRLAPKLFDDLSRGRMNLARGEVDRVQSN